MSGVRDIGKIMQSRLDFKPSPAASAMRKCEGPCKKRKSVGQFTGASTLCLQCARRTPKQNGVTNA